MSRTLSESHKKAMQAGRDRKLKQRRKEAVARVKAYRVWVQKDADLRSAWKSGDSTYKQYIARRPAMPAIPTDADYDIARGQAV